MQAAPDRRSGPHPPNPLMRIAVLVPDPDYPEPWRWTYDPEAKALTDAGADVTPIAWTEAADRSVFDLVLPLVVWGYHVDYQRWLELLDRAERGRWRVINPPAPLRCDAQK